MKSQDDSLSHLDTSFLPRAPKQRWHSVSRRSDLRPLSQGRSFRKPLAVVLAIVMLAFIGSSAAWIVNRGFANDEQVTSAQPEESVIPTPQAPTVSPAAASTPVASITPEFHIVQPGEVLSAIASKYNTTVEVLAEINNIENVDTIRVGQRLRLVPAQQ